MRLSKIRRVRNTFTPYERKYKIIRFANFYLITRFDSKKKHSIPTKKQLRGNLKVNIKRNWKEYNAILRLTNDI